MRKVLSLAIASLLATAAACGPALGSELAAGKAAKAQITVEQRERLAIKLRLIDQIMRAAEPDMQAQQTPASSRQWVMEKLLKMPLEQVRAVGMPGSFAATSNAISKAAHLKAIGDGSTDLEYRPITPCRFIDTRNVGGPIIGSRTFDLDAAGDTYGGSASCNIVTASGILDADDMAAVAINVAIVSPTNAPGFLGARPAGSSNTTALVNWYQAGAQVQASNAGVIPTFQGAGDEIEFFGSPTQIIVDVFGVFTRAGATTLDCVYPSTPLTIANGARDFTTVNCTAGYQVTGGGLSAPFNTGLVVQASGPNGNGWFASLLNTSGGTITETVFAACCRVPGR